MILCSNCRNNLKREQDDMYNMICAKCEREEKDKNE